MYHYYQKLPRVIFPGFAERLLKVGSGEALLRKVENSAASLLGFRLGAQFHHSGTLAERVRFEPTLRIAFEEYGQPYASHFVPERVHDLLALIHDTKLPKRSEVQITFLADSLSGRPELSLRSSRDICERERARERQKSRHHIIRNEF